MGRSGAGGFPKISPWKPSPSVCASWASSSSTGSSAGSSAAFSPNNQRLLEAIAEALGCQPVDLLIRDPSDPDGVWTVWETLSPIKKRELVAIGRALDLTGTDD